jgi:hypothetical protein
MDLFGGLDSSHYLRSDVAGTLHSTLYIQNPNTDSWCENLRLVPANNGWTTIHMGGALGSSGTALGQWSLHTFDSKFLICDGGSSPGNGLCLTESTISFRNNVIWHAGNDGHGSGLDADTIDGVQADSLIQAVGNHWHAGNFEVHSTDPSNSYSNAAIELREVNLVTNTQLGNSYAPCLGFHWGNVAQGRLMMDCHGRIGWSGAGTGDGFVPIMPSYGTNAPSVLGEGEIYLVYE